MLPASVLEHAPLEAVDIYFDTATFDEIERDVKVGVLNQHTVGEKGFNEIT